MTLLGKGNPSRTSAGGYAAAVAVVLVLTAAFYIDRDYFLENAHNFTAFTMFGFIILVVWLNRLRYRTRPGRPSLKGPYTVVAVAMAGALGLVVFGHLVGWDHWIIAVEAILIALFAAFWSIQTYELWSEGIKYSARATA